VIGEGTRVVKLVLATTTACYPIVPVVLLNIALSISRIKLALSFTLNKTYSACIAAVVLIASICFN
jgi:hypothetical protein